MNTSCNPQAGNVLFLILIAVALFATLSYAVTQSSRTGGRQSGAEEKVIMSTARLMNYGSQMQATIDRMRISQSLDITEIYIENNGTKWWDDNSRYCCLDTIPTPERGLFHPAGGGMVLQSFEDLGLPFSGGTKAGHTTYVWVNMPGVGSSDADLVMWTVALKENVCQGINDKAGIAGIPNIDFHENDFATGSPIPSIGAATGTASDIEAITGKNDLCFRYGDGRLFYQRVLKES